MEGVAVDLLYLEAVVGAQAHTEQFEGREMGNLYQWQKRNWNNKHQD